nr:adipocyte plasma membrane-associated protein-like [Danaus plexippus plexippus]
MGLIIGMFKLILRIILVLSAIAAFILLIPNLPPYTKFTSIKVEPTLERSGSLAYNNILNQAAQLYKDKLLGPECFQVWNDELYTSLATGEIVKLSRGRHVTFVTKIGHPCTGLTQEHICGRPLGFVIDENKKNLIVADSYYGIWKVNLESDKKQLLVSPHVAIEGTVPMLFNSVALASNGDIYWTHSSSDFHLKDGMFAIFSDPSGRLLHYNPTKNESKVLLDNLWFANGLAISPDNQFVVVAETSRYKLTKYYISGPKKGKSEAFIAGLPGIPDTVRPLPDGSGILVSLYNVFDDENPLIIKSLAETPLARKFIARLLRLIEIPFEFLQNHFDNHVFESIVYYVSIS